MSMLTSKLSYNATAGALPNGKFRKCAFLRPGGKSAGDVRHIPGQPKLFQRPRKANKTTASTAVVADAVTAAIPSNVNPLLLGTTAYSGALLVLMLAAPFSVRLRQFFRSTAMFLPLALSYLILLVQAWTPETWSLILPGNLESGFKSGFNPQFFPQLSGIMRLFSQPATIASFWVHILTVNLVFARSCLLDGLNKQIPTWHTVCFSAIFGPLGVISHILTLMVVSTYRMMLGRDVTGLPRPAVMKTNSGGTITILPY